MFRILLVKHPKGSTTAPTAAELFSTTTNSVIAPYRDTIDSGFSILFDRKYSPD